METSELTKIATAHQAAISRHDEEMAEIRAILRQGFARSEQAIAQHDREMAAIRAQQQLNAQALAQFTAGLEELRILVADYLRGRENL